MKKLLITVAILFAWVSLVPGNSASLSINPMVADDPSGAMCRVGSIWYDGVDYWYCRYPGVPVNLGH